MRHRIGIGIVLLWVSGMALAEGPAKAVPEASMDVTGTIDIDASGVVTGHAIDHARSIDSAVVKLIDGVLPTWRFEPLPADGKVHSPRMPMSLLIVAKQVADNKFTARIQSAHFGDPDGQPGESVSADRMAPPTYPELVQRSQVVGTIYVALRVDRSGHVAEAIAEQVDVGTLDFKPASARATQVLTAATLKAARAWTFHPPTTGKWADAPFWSVRVPICYQMGTSSPAGKWHPYIPGPRQHIPWLDAKDDRVAAASPEGMLAGSIESLGLGRQLLSPVGND